MKERGEGGRGKSLKNQGEKRKTMRQAFISGNRQVVSSHQCHT